MYCEIFLTLTWYSSVEKYRPGYQETLEEDTQGGALRSVDTGW